MNLTRRQLSSSLTVVGAFALPALWFSILGPATVLILSSDYKDKWGIVPVWLLVIGFCYWTVWRHKTVVLEKRLLYISDLVHTTTVRVNEIAAVGESVVFPGHPVRIEFKHPTRFGNSITFIPYYHFHVGPFYSHPVVTELRKLAGLPRDGHD